jgi:hypothetical protein
MRCLDAPYQDSRNMELGYKITKKTLSSIKSPGWTVPNQKENGFW